MKKYFFFLITGMLSVSSLWAQHNAGILYTNHFHLQAARFQPSKLGLSASKIDIHAGPLLGLQAWSGNTTLNIEDIVNLFDEETITTAEVDEIVND
ncbi:MAG: hypothetical protein AAFU64_12605, partial [Bacteroidota bacterium]